MIKRCNLKLSKILTRWLTKERSSQSDMPLSDFERLRYEVRPCDIILVEGLSRMSEMIRLSTHSPWSHSMLYIGRLYDIENSLLRQRVREYYQGDESEQLVIESLLGKGTIVTPLAHYRHKHMRICRPKGISLSDAQKVISYVVSRVGFDYDVRQILDLGRLMLPFHLFPRRWRSSLFTHNRSNQTNRQICSSLLAEAFASVNFPVLPVVKRASGSDFELVQRNPRLYTPSDFDYSPFFEIIKYPFFSLVENGMYRCLPWSANQMSNDEAGIIYFQSEQTEPSGERLSKVVASEQPLGYLCKNNKVATAIYEQTLQQKNDKVGKKIHWLKKWLGIKN